MSACEDSDKTGRMPRPIWVFAGRKGHSVVFVTRRFQFQLKEIEFVTCKFIVIQDEQSNHWQVWCRKQFLIINLPFYRMVWNALSLFDLDKSHFGSCFKKLLNVMYCITAKRWNRNYSTGICNCFIQVIEKTSHPNLSRDIIKPTKWLCAQWRLRSAWASAKPDQSHRCVLNGYLRIQPFFMQTAKTDQTGQMPRLICGFAGRTVILLVLTCRGSFADGTVCLK